MGCVRRYLEAVVPCRFRILLTFLVNWRTGSVCNGVLPSFIVLGNRFLLYSTRFQPQDCRSLLNLLPLDATGLPAALPSTHQGMHPWLALETSTLRRMSLVQHSSAVGFPRSYRHLRTFRGNRTRCGGGTCRNKIRRHIYLLVATLTQLFLFFFLFWILFATVEHLLKLKFWEQQSKLKWLMLIKQMKKIVPLITCEISWSQHVCELVFGVNVTDLNLCVQINPVKQPIQSISVCSWNMFHCGTSTFDNHFDYRLIVPKDMQHSTGIRVLCIGWNVINVCWNDVGVLDWDGVMHVWFDDCWRGSRSSLLGPSVLFGTEWNTSITKSHRVRAGKPSMRRPAPKERTSDSVELCEAEVCVLHIQLTGTNVCVWLPKIHKILPEVDSESSQSQQCLSLGIIPICIVVRYFPHDNIA